MHIWSPFTPVLDFPLLRDVVAEADPCVAVEACVGLFVDLARAVGIGGDLRLVALD